MWILGLAAALSFLFFGIAVLGPLTLGRAEKRLKSLGEKPLEASSTGAVRELDDRKSLADRLSKILGPLGSFAERKEGRVYESVRRRLVEAGFRQPTALSIYMGSRVVASGGLAVLVIILSWSLARIPPIPLIGIAAAVGYVLPGIIVDRLRSRRQAQIQRGLPDAIDLMVVCVEAGLGLGATFKRVAVEFKYTSPIIAREFESTIVETQAGRGLMDALRGLADRTGVQELRLLISLVIQTDRFGTPMVETLRAQGDAIRHARMQRAEEMAQKAPVKMTFPAGLIFLAVLMILGGPAMIMLRGVFPE
jgi:tight adherence protein C